MKKILCVLPIFVIFIISELDYIQCEDSISTPFKLEKFTGGWDTMNATNKLDYSFSPNILNCDIDETNTIKIRKGSTLAYTLPVSNDTPLFNGFSAVYDDGSSELFVHAGTGIYKTSGSGAWTCIVNGISSKYIMQFAMFKGEVWMTNGIDDVRIWNKETYTPYSFIPKGRYILVDKEQVIMGGLWEDPSAIRFSNLFTATGNFSTAKLSSDWPGENRIPLGVGDGQIINGLFKMQNKVYAAKDKSIYGLLTDANYLGAYPFLYTTLYGSVSQRSISNYKDFKILLDKAGLGAYNGGSNVEILTKNLDNVIKKIGLINTNYGRWTITSNTDFSTGTFSNCYNHTGTVEISSNVKTWTTTADFTGGTQNAVNILNDEIHLSTSGGGLVLGNIDSAQKTYDGNGSSQIQGDINWSKDTIDDTGVGIAFTRKDRGWGCSYFLANAPVKVKKVQVLFRPVNYCGYTFGLGTFSSFSPRLTINTLQMVNTLGTWYDLPVATALEAASYFSIPGVSSNNLFAYYEGNNPVVRTATFLISDENYNSAVYSQIDKINFYGGGYSDYSGIAIYEVKFWSESSASYYSSPGSYISPNYTAGGATAQYQYLYTSDNLSHASATSSDTIKYYASNVGGSNSTDWTYLGLSSGSYTTFPIPSNLDNNTNFYWKAELVTSSITATPSIFSASLQYTTTGYGYYRSKVYNVGDKITSWGSFLASYTGTALFRVRASSNTYDLTVNTLPESGANQWAYITSGNNLLNVITSTNNKHIQIEAQLHTKNTKIESLTATWFEGGEGSGGEQDTPSINYRDRYYLAYSTWANYNTDVLVFDKNGAFTRYDWKVSGFVEFDNKLYFLSSTDNKIYQALTGTDDNGQPIKFVYDFPDMDFGYPDIKKSVDLIYLTGKKQSGSGVNVELYLDYSAIPTTLGQSNNFYADFSADSNYRIVGSSQSYAKNIRISLSTTTAADLEISGIIPYMIPKNLGD